MKKRPRIESFGEALGDALQSFGLERRIKEQELVQRWPELVGSAIAKHATPLRFLNGTLWLQVDDATWRHELFLHRADLAATLNRALRLPLVAEVILR